MDILLFISSQIPIRLAVPAILGLIWFYVACKPMSRPRASYGPRRYPVVGSLFSFSRNRARLPEWFTEMLRESPTQTITVERLGGIKTVVTANPVNVEHILKTRFENYPKGEPFTSILRDLLGDGIFNADGEAWKLQRRAASHEFSTRSLRTLIMEAVGGEVRDRLLPLLRAASGRPAGLDMQDILKRFAFDNICRVAFGMDPRCLEPPLPVSELAQAFDVASELSSERSTAPVSLVWRAKRMLNVGSERRLSRAIRVVHGFAMDVIRRRKSELACAGHVGGPRRDLLSRFVALAGQRGGPSDEFLRDMLVSFILAGRDTTSAALTWFFWLLSAHPRVEEAIQREIAQVWGAPALPEAPPLSYEELQEMHYLHASICESMRLYPPVPADSKHALQDDVLPDGTFVSRGTRVTYHPYAMGRMESLWGADCMEFRPERWLDADCRFVPQSPFKFAVFQGGMRVCLGREMAFIQMKYIAASVVREFRLLPLDSRFEPTFLPSLTARMKGGLPVVVHGKLTPQA